MTATPDQLLAAIAAVRHYARHEWKCSGDGFLPKGLSCICGLHDVLRGIDAMLAGRVTNHPERPESSSGDDDGN